MDNIFGIGLPELVLILVIAGMVMGPERIARTARTLGGLTAKLQSVSRTFLRQLNAELDSVDQDGQLRNTVDELQQLRRQVAELRGEIMSVTGGTANETRQVMRDIKREAENAIMPPSLTAAIKPPAQPTPPTPQPPPATNAGIYRPPSLLGNDARPPANGQPIPAAPPPTLPRLVSVADDPEE